MALRTWLEARKKKLYRQKGLLHIRLVVQTDYYKPSTEWDTDFSTTRVLVGFLPEENIKRKVSPGKGADELQMIGEDHIVHQMRDFHRRTDSELTRAYEQMLTELKREPLATEVTARRRENRKPKPAPPPRPAKSFHSLFVEFMTAAKFGESRRATYGYWYDVFNDFLNSLEGKPAVVREIYRSIGYQPRKDEDLPAFNFDVAKINLEFLHSFERYIDTKPNYLDRGKAQPRGIAGGAKKLYIGDLLRVIKFGQRQRSIAADLLFDYQPGVAPAKKEKKNRINRLVSPEDLVRIEAEPPVDMPLGLRYWRKFFLMQSWCGLSFVDLWTYAVNDLITIDFSGRRSIVYSRVKTKEQAIVPYFEELEKAISGLDGDCKPKVGNYESGRKYYREMVIALFKFYQIPMKKKVGAHTGRHLFGQRMLDKGFTIEAVSRMMGHASKDETERVYAPADADKIYADLDKIDKLNKVLNQQSNETSTGTNA